MALWKDVVECYVTVYPAHNATGWVLIVMEVVTINTLVVFKLM